MYTFRVHTNLGIFDVEASSPDQARKKVLSENTSARIFKVKRLQEDRRGEAP